MIIHIIYKSKLDGETIVHINEVTLKLNALFFADRGVPTTT